MFGSSMSLDCFGGFLNQITTGNKRYSHLAIGSNVGLFLRVRRYNFQRVPQSNYKLRPEKKGTVVWDGQMTVPFFSG